MNINAVTKNTYEKFVLQILVRKGSENLFALNVS
jgi:hypothetical protein